MEACAFEANNILCSFLPSIFCREKLWVFTLLDWLQYLLSAGPLAMRGLGLAGRVIRAGSSSLIGGLVVTTRSEYCFMKLKLLLVLLAIPLMVSFYIFSWNKCGLEVAALARTPFCRTLPLLLISSSILHNVSFEVKSSGSRLVKLGSLCTASSSLSKCRI